VPVMPQTSRLRPSSVSPSRRSTQVMASRKRASCGESGQPGSRTGITGISSFLERARKALISGVCQAPIPSAPTNTATEREARTPSSSPSCQGRPGRSSSLSSQTRRPRPRRSLAISSTTGLSWLLWLRKTSNPSGILWAFRGGLVSCLAASFPSST